MENPLDYTGKVVIVTGARSGIGQATAIAFAKQGAKVVMSGRRPCKETAEKIAEFDGEATFIKCDVSVPEEVENLVKETVNTYGQLNVAINCAGSLPPTKELVDQSIEDFDKTMNIDAKGVFLALKYEIPAIIEAGGGAIVNVASVAGIVADPGMAPYVAAKHAAVGLTRAAGIEYASQNVRINAIAPGFVASEMTQGWMDDPEMVKLVSGYNFQNRIADPKEIANVCLFLGSDLTSFMGGAIIPIDAGQTAH